MSSMWEAFMSGLSDDAAEALNASPIEPSSDSVWGSFLEPYIPSSPSTPQPYEGGKVSTDYVVKGLVDRGLPLHVAEGFAMNFQDESGMDPGINEINPIVKGSRGGYGLYQLTGPRRRQYEAYADQKGVDYSDPDAQMDFLMWELENTEKGAAQAIMSSTNAGEAGAAIVNKFLRPAEKHRAHRSSKYMKDFGSTSGELNG